MAYTITRLEKAVLRYVRTRRDRGVAANQIKQELSMILSGIRDHRIPDDAIIIIDAM